MYTHAVFVYIYMYVYIQYLFLPTYLQHAYKFVKAILAIYGTLCSKTAFYTIQ